jgi:hypothetical protein
MVADFGQNVTQRLGRPEAQAPTQVQAINPVSVLFSILWQKIKNVFGTR